MSSAGERRREKRSCDWPYPYRPCSPPRADRCWDPMRDCPDRPPPAWRATPGRRRQWTLRIWKRAFLRLMQEPFMTSAQRTRYLRSLAHLDLRQRYATRLMGRFRTERSRRCRSRSAGSVAGAIDTVGEHSASSEDHREIITTEMVRPNSRWGDPTRLDVVPGSASAWKGC